jgi:hypothetical protein
MKETICLLLGLMLTGASLRTQAQNPGNFSLLNMHALGTSGAAVRAQRDFLKREGDQKGEQWYKISDGFLAEFEETGHTCSVYYDERGNWSGSIRALGEKELPVDVRRLVRSTYLDYSIFWVKEIQKDESLIYNVHIENDTSGVILRIMSRKGKVLVAMSGGIDSTVTAMMLHDEGYEVVGITMKTWDYASAGASKKETGCCNLDSFNDARMAAVQHGFPHFVLDIREEFGDFVIENFVDEYLAGRTPNPCVLCNTHIKWRALLKRADAMDCEFIATGHYGQVRLGANGRYTIAKGCRRDQGPELCPLGPAAGSAGQDAVAAGALP